jgi:hypothetical protein
MKLYFDNRNGKHDYIDEFSFKYTSTTTFIHSFVKPFESDKLAKACERIGANPNHPKYEKYKGMKSWQIIQMWDRDAKDGCAIGNTHHDKLEDDINLSMFTTKPQQILTSKGYTLFTIDDIINNPEYGVIDIDKLNASDLKVIYPEIYDALLIFINKGYSIYVELGLFDFEYKISGLGDIIPIHIKNKHFFVLDWKTNKIPIIKTAGYFDKDNQRNTLLDKFIASDEKLLAPIAHLPNAHYYIYALQLNIYQRMIAKRGFTCGGRMIIHIRRELYTYDEALSKNNILLEGKNKINFVMIENLQKEVEVMFQHKKKQELIAKNGQANLFESIF